MKKVLNNSKIARRIIYIFILFFSSASIYWADSYTIMCQNLAALDKLFKGEFFQCNFTWGVICQIFLSVFDLPIYFVNKCLGINVYTSFFIKLLAKLDLIGFIFITGLFISKILGLFHCSEEEKEAGLLMTISSTFAFVTCCIIGQVDIIGVMFSAIALYYLIKEDNIKFFLFFCIAVQFKYFPLFYFIPIILYKEKNLMKAGIKIGVPVIICYILNLPFKSANNEVLSNNIGAEILENLTKTKIPIMGNEVPLVFLVFGAICFWAYVKKYDAEKAKYYYVYYGFMGMVSILTLYKLQGYRIIYLTPFIVLLFFINKENRKQRLLLEMSGTGGVTLGIALFNYWFFDFYNMRGNLIDFILPINKFECIGQEYIYRLVIQDQYYSLWLLLYAVFIIWVGYVLITHYPEKIIHTKTDEDENVIKMMDIRMVISFFVANSTITLYIMCIIRNIIGKLL